MSNKTYLLNIIKLFSNDDNFNFLYQIHYTNFNFGLVMIFIIGLEIFKLFITSGFVPL